MRVGAVAVVLESLGPPILGKVGAVQVGVRDTRHEEWFVRVECLAGSSNKRVPIHVADISALQRDPIGQLVLNREVVLVNLRQRDLNGPEFRTDSVGQWKSPIRAHGYWGGKGRSLGQCKHIGESIWRVDVLLRQNRWIL